MLKTFAIVLAAIFALAAVNTAKAADLPSRSLIDSVFPTSPAPMPVVPTTGFYIGGTLSNAFEANRLGFGAVGGYDFGLVRLEATYDRFATRPATNLLMGNVLFETDVDTAIGRFTPYVLGGAGVAFGSKFGDRVGVYNVGVGTRYVLTQNVDLDLRYRYVAPIERRRGHEHVGTIGVQFRF